MIEEPAATAEAPVDRPVQTSRVWRMVVIVVTFQLVVIAAGTFFFTAMGFANEPAGSCGGG